MDKISIAVLVMCAIAFYVGFYHLFFYLTRKESKLSCYFAAVCFSIGFYEIACVGLYNTESVTTGVFWQKFQFFSLTMLSIAVFHFTYILIARKQDWILHSYTTIMGILFSAGILFNNQITSINDPIVRTVHFLSLSITYYETKPILLMNILYILMLTGMICAFSLMIDSLINHHRKDLWLIIVGFSVFFVSAVSDVFIGSQMISFIYTTEYSFLLIIITMDHTLLLRFVGLFYQVENINIKLEEKVAERTNKIQSMVNDAFYLNNQLEEKNRILAELVERDGLTKLYNQVAFKRRLEEVLNLAQRYSFEFSMAMIDIDWFKQINDKYGHIVGDQVIRKVGEILNSGHMNSDLPAPLDREHAVEIPKLRNYDIAGRYGGDEFGLLISFCGENGIKVVVDKICRCTKEIVIEDCAEIQISLSVGAVVIKNPLKSDDAKKIIQRADHALYLAKKQGRNQVVIEMYDGKEVLKLSK